MMSQITLRTDDALKPEAGGASEVIESSCFMKTYLEREGLYDIQSFHEASTASVKDILEEAYEERLHERNLF